MKWANWSKTLELTAEASAPRSVEDLRAVLQWAALTQTPVRPFGARHSHTAVAAPTELALDLVHFDAIEITGDQVRVGAGVRLHRLNAVLAQAGRALSNLGDIDCQSIAGAISTGTHGTGLTYGSLASQVRALELMLPTGELVEVSGTTRPDLFAAATVGLGLFGVITAVTLATVPLFYLDAHERAVPLPQLLADLDGFFAGADHAEFYLFPGTEVALTKENRRTEEPGQRSALSRLWSEEVVENGLLQLVSSLGATVPALIRPLNRLAAHTVGERSYRDRSAGVFTSPRRVRFLEIEYALPYEALAWALNEVTSYLNTHQLRLNFPIEVRVGPAELSWLAPSYGRTSAYLAVQQYHRLPFPALSSIESILVAAGGRPHWGKLHSRTGQDLAGLYPRYADAVALRRQIDPSGLLLTPYLADLLG